MNGVLFVVGVVALVVAALGVTLVAAIWRMLWGWAFTGPRRLMAWVLTWIKR